MSKNEKVSALLGKDSEWEGNLKFDGSVTIDGYFKGEILSEGTLSVGDDGLIEGNIHVSYLVIYGEVHGDIIADHRVDIFMPGKVFGNIQSPSVIMDKGVIFEGTTKMYHAKGIDNGKTTLVESDKYNSGPPPKLTAIYGIISDQITGKPIKHAEVKCKGKNYHDTNTNASGYYELINLKDGKWKMRVKVKGYKKGKAKVEISEGGTYKQDFELYPKKR